MFRYLVTVGPPMRDLSDVHPVYLEALLERCWNRQVNVGGQPLGHPDHRSDLPGRPEALLDALLPAGGVVQPRTLGGGAVIDVGALDAAIRGARGTRWHHLAYAFMIENTRVVEVFQAVAQKFLQGEQIGTLRPASQRWLWTTEELFLRAPPSYSVQTQTSLIRAGMAENRSNAYQRLLGVPIDTKSDKGALAVPAHTNQDFISTMDELLYEIWQGRSNYANQSGARPTDDAKIEQLARRLSSMLLARRMNGTLSREEFAAVCAMSWFHATLADGQHALLQDLRADAPSPEERLFKIAERVGVPAHGLSKSYFEIAEPLSRLLIGIEQGTYNNVAAIPALYTPAAGGPYVDADVVLTHWSIIRGRDVKAKKIAA